MSIPVLNADLANLLIHIISCIPVLTCDSFYGCIHENHKKCMVQAPHKHPSGQVPIAELAHFRPGNLGLEMGPLIQIWDPGFLCYTFTSIQIVLMNTIN